MKKFRLFLFGSTILASSAAGLPALAIVAPDDFSASVSFSGSCSDSSCSGTGSFTLTNDSSEWYITGLVVDLGGTNVTSADAYIDGSATFPVSDWFTCSTTGEGCSGFDASLGLQYYNISGSPSENLGEGTFTGFDFDIDYTEPRDPPITFDITNGVADLSCTGNINIMNGSTGGCDPPVPEPGSLSLLGAGLALLGLRRRQRRAD